MWIVGVALLAASVALLIFGEKRWGKDNGYGSRARTEEGLQKIVLISMLACFLFGIIFLVWGVLK